ncbi:VanZ family protein [Metabacillus litoralis]|uniref:VanZ family protein n=1 Tax=Metabacillus litoralis TaxID=152268 RepID=UPI001CFCC598|nr:VanZ family protein [Metabacillus litoralis]
MRKVLKLLVYISFFAYLCFLLYLLFFSHYRQSVEGVIAYNLVPFTTIQGYFSTFTGFSLTDQFIGNILAFLPFGFLIVFIIPRSSLMRILIYTFVLSFGIECLQILFRVGAFDVDDLLLNTVGGVIGYVFSLLFQTKKIEVDLEEN